MSLIEIAKIYTMLVKMDDETPDVDFQVKGEVNDLRTRYHGLLMDKLTEEGIEFSDRFDAMNKAFNIVGKQKVYS